MKIAITNCWSYYNKGDASIASATIKLLLTSFPNAEITVLAFDPQSFSENKYCSSNQVKLLPMPSLADSLSPLRTLFNLSSSLNLQRFFGPLFLIFSLAFMKPLRSVDKRLDQTLKSIDDSDLIVAVGGNYLYSHVGFYVHSLPIVYGKFVQRKKTILLGHSIGPFDDFSSRLVSRLILERMDLVVFREAISMSYVSNNLKAKLPNAIVSCDMALFLQPSKAFFSDSTPNNRVGITVRPWLFNDLWLYQHYMDSITQVALLLIKNGFEISLIPFSTIAGSEDDSTPCNVIYKLIVEKHPQSIHLIDIKNKPPESVVQTLEDLELNLLIGTRFHSVLLSSIVNVPSVIISYQHFKAQGISQQLGLTDYVLTIEHLDINSLTKSVENLIDNNKSVRKILYEKVTELRKQEVRIRSMLLSLIHA